MSRKPTSGSKATSDKNQRKPKPLKTLKLARRDSSDALEPPTKKYHAGFALSNPPVFDLTKEDTIMPSGSQGSASSSRMAKPVRQSQRPSVDVKGKSKETRTPVDDEDDRLWVDKYEPTSEAELAVHKRKVEDVRRWLLEAFEGGPSAKLRKYRRILALSGPAGTAKTSTLRVLSRELDFEILEWRNSMSERGPSVFTNDEPGPNEGLDFDAETLFDKFQAFLTRAMACNSIFGHHNATRIRSQTQSSTQRSSKRQLILLEDLPNLLHQPTQMRFQAALRSLCIPTSNLSEPPGPPIVIILSDSGLRAEQPDDDNWGAGSSARRWDKKEVLDIRNVLGPELLTSPYVTRIGFNPIAPTLMTKALQTLLASHFGSLDARGREGKQPPREVIDIVVGSSNGDIRSAIMALQFACVVDLPASSMGSKGKAARKNAGGTKRTTSVRAVLEAVTRREQSLVLFHLLGKILYNKRKFDPPASHLSSKDAAKERELDMQLIDPPPLPVWISPHNRRASRVCAETLTAESPIDSSLLGLYTHQNYTQFCTDIDQCDGICEGLSWVDCIGGALSANSPYAFRTLTLSSLHSLPTPVPRSGQKVCKPTWFDVRTRELEASDAVGDVLSWLGKNEAVGRDMDQGALSSVSAGKWTHANVATELGGWLGALNRCNGDRSKLQGGHHPQPPRTHRLFSYLPWSLGAVGGDVLGENEDGEVERGGDDDEDRDARLPGKIGDGEEGKGWLEDDDIEDAE
ncbi:Rad17 cell cycle checkpoint protein-domain-containing protein [Boletus reticuloceps]|uniref:Rad17 cell cycle checkpoint protein-domain-containing protein n=1 Tax=Boletus reticuloceps TaxID=495285 RepID=A0A8I2YWM7_9AGAM|nr:Rad17 cell cycle checkpoint protein-domain-containing protein [Boletus reticuloceps]